LPKRRTPQPKALGNDAYDLLDARIERLERVVEELRFIVAELRLERLLANERKISE
jgi:hypothetical protein